MIFSKVRSVMEERGMTYRTLKDKTGLSLPTIERARGPLIRECRLSTLEAIARALGCGVKDLFDEVPDVAEPQE